MVLTYLGTLDPVYSSIRPQIMWSSVVSSLPDIYHFLKIIVHVVSSSTTTTSSDQSALVAQGRQTIGGRGGGRADMMGQRGYTCGCFGGQDSTRGGRGGPQGGWGDGVIYCYYCKKLGHIKYQCPYWRENQREVHISLPLFQMMSNCDVSLNSSILQQQNNIQAQYFSFSVTLAQRGTLISCFTSFMLHNWIINSGGTNHMTGNRGIMSFFTHTSNSVVLADGSRTSIQGIGATAITPTFPLSFVSHLPCFPFNLLSVRLLRF